MNSMEHTYLFILSPPKCGSTLMHQILASSPHVSALPDEGMQMNEVRDWMLQDRWDEDKQMPWLDIEKAWKQHWDLDKPILLEKSPPNIARADQIDQHFEPTKYVVLMRHPYAFCQSALTSNPDKNTPENVARYWLRYARFQRSNIESLDHIIHLTYEQFVAHPDAVLEKLVEFFPELEELSTESIETMTYFGAESSIRDLNPIKFQLLRGSTIRRINEVLRQDEEVLTYFGYDLIEPGWRERLNTGPAKVAYYAFRGARKYLPSSIVNSVEDLYFQAMGS